jgi:hypothetical protein
MDETMTNAERDKKINEMHAAIMVEASRTEEHHKTLYGNGQPGICKEFDVVKTRQEECPARKAVQPSNKIANMAMFVAIAALVWQVVTKIS